MKGVPLSLGLSIAVALIAVNAPAENLSSVNKDNSHKTSPPKASGAPAVSKLVSTVLVTGDDMTVGSNIAPIIGAVPGASGKAQEIEFSAAPKEARRSCYVIFEPMPRKARHRPTCVYLVYHTTGEHQRKSHYFRMTLDGHLEKAVLVSGQIDSDGRPVRGSGTKADEDVNSPETLRAFEAERAYWLKDWLKKQEKGAAAKK